MSRCLILAPAPSHSSYRRNQRLTRFHTAVGMCGSHVLNRIAALFEDQAEAGEEAKPSQVAPAALQAFLNKMMAAERLTEAEAKERAKLHVEPATFASRQWSGAWKEAPNKRLRGETGSVKSDT